MSESVSSLEKLLPLLRCPLSGHALERTDAGDLVSVAFPTHTYRLVHGKPVLINFAESVLDETSLFARAGDSPIERSARERWGWLRWLTKQDKRITVGNIQLFMRLLKEGSSEPRVLIVGGGSIGKGVESLYEDSRVGLVGCDIYNSPHVDVIADAHRLPFADGVFDGVVIQAVLEHVAEPQVVVAEIARVLRSNGLAYAETPFMQPVHEGAYDFTRFTESGHRYLFRQFETIRSGTCSGVGAYLQWSVEYFVRSLLRNRRAGKVAKVLLFWLPLLDRLVPDKFNIDAACGVFFLGKKTGRRLSPKEIIQHYQGAQH